MKLTQFTKRKDRKKQLAKLLLYHETHGMSHMIWPKFLDRDGLVLLEIDSVDRRRLLRSANFLSIQRSSRHPIESLNDNVGQRNLYWVIKFYQNFCRIFKYFTGCYPRF